MLSATCPSCDISLTPDQYEAHVEACEEASLLDLDAERHDADLDIIAIEEAPC